MLLFCSLFHTAVPKTTCQSEGFDEEKSLVTKTRIHPLPRTSIPLLSNLILKQRDRPCRRIQASRVV